MFLLYACAESLLESATPTCDPRVLAPGEVRARPIACGEEAISGGEGRVGDWLIENAVARFAVRGSYAALTELDAEGGTLVDAAVPGGEDLLVELRVDGDRSSVSAVQGDGYAELVSPGVAWRLDADSATLTVEAVGTGRMLGDPGTRSGLTLREGEAFFGLDGDVLADAGAVEFAGLTRVALTDDARGWEQVAGNGDADFVRVERRGMLTDRIPVLDGAFAGYAPAEATLVGERAGCTYDGLSLVACGSLHVRARDDAGHDLAVTVSDGVEAWPVPRGGGRVPVGPEPRTVHLWAGPAYNRASIWFPGGQTEAAVTLHRELSADGWVLADLARETAPDADTARTPTEAVDAATAEGFGFVALLADDEIPSRAELSREGTFSVAASRAAERVWTWTWSANSRRAAHGALPWQGLAPADILAGSVGGQGSARISIVTTAWIAEARTVADPSRWLETPDAVWMEGPEDLPVYLDLLREWVDVAPAAARTWARVTGATNIPAVEAALVDGAVSAGNGPRISIVASRSPDPALWFVDVEVEAPRWMGTLDVRLWTSAGERTLALTDGRVRLRVRGEEHWAVASVLGASAEPPWLDVPAWAVTGPAWLEGP